jgi:hypothetical protein
MNLKQRKIYRLARQYLSFDKEKNWTGDDRPMDIKAYWATLNDTERAFEILERTDAAVFMEFVERIERNVPKIPIKP